jgi:hypothetical protein
MSVKKKKASTQPSASAIAASVNVAAVVVGDGWAALATVAFIAHQLRQESLTSGKPADRAVIWVAGGGARMNSALPGLETGPGVEVWQKLARDFGIDAGETQQGSYLREFRNKGFREPTWTKAPTPELRKEVMAETLWAPECQLAPLWESRFTLTLNEIEERLRAQLMATEDSPWTALIRRIEGVPVASIQSHGGATSITLQSGEEIAAPLIYFADRWSLLPGIAGIPKGLEFNRRREPTSVLQATFKHPTPVGVGLQEGFFNTLHKESGEEFERHFFGHFSSDGSQSYWTICLTMDEIEDNHLIAKKLRRLKNGLDKMFSGTAWVPEGQTEFMQNVGAEQVRFQEFLIFAEGEAPTEPVTLKGFDHLWFLTDGYGPSSALQQVRLALGLNVEPVSVEFDVPALVGLNEPAPNDADPEAKHVDVENPDAPETLGGGV